MSGYLNNTDFEASILAGDREAVARSLLLLAGRVIRTWGHSLPSEVDRDDLRQDAALAALRRLEGWDRNRGPAFAYCTDSVKFSIRDRRRKAIRHAGRFARLPKSLAS